MLEEHTDFGTDILTSSNINPDKNIFRNNQNTLHDNHTILNHINTLAPGPLTIADGVTLTVEGNLSVV